MVNINSSERKEIARGEHPSIDSCHSRSSLGLMESTNQTLSVVNYKTIMVITLSTKAKGHKSYRSGHGLNAYRCELVAFMYYCNF